MNCFVNICVGSNRSLYKLLPKAPKYLIIRYDLSQDQMTSHLKKSNRFIIHSFPKTYNMHGYLNIEKCPLVTFGDLWWTLTSSNDLWSQKLQQIHSTHALSFPKTYNTHGYLNIEKWPLVTFDDLSRAQMTSDLKISTNPWWN